VHVLEVEKIGETGLLQAEFGLRAADPVLCATVTRKATTTCVEASRQGFLS
jgi:hypothetical protein